MARMSRHARLCTSVSIASYQVQRRTGTCSNAGGQGTSWRDADRVQVLSAEREKAHAHAEQSDEEADEEMVARALEGEAEEAAAQPQQIEA